MKQNLLTDRIDLAVQAQPILNLNLSLRPLQRVQKAAIRDQEEVRGVLAAAEEEQEEQQGAVRVGAEGGGRVGAGGGAAVQG